MKSRHLGRETPSAGAPTTSTVPSANPRGARTSREPGWMGRGPVTVDERVGEASSWPSSRAPARPGWSTSTREKERPASAAWWPACSRVHERRARAVTARSGSAANALDVRLVERGSRAGISRPLVGSEIEIPREHAGRRKARLVPPWSAAGRHAGRPVRSSTAPRIPRSSSRAETRRGFVRTTIALLRFHAHDAPRRSAPRGSARRRPPMLSDCHGGSHLERPRRRRKKRPRLSLAGGILEAGSGR